LKFTKLNYVFKGRGYTFIATTFIVGVLGIQSLTIVTPILPIKFIGADRHWPVVTYPMYTKSYVEGDYINVKLILTIKNKAGEEIEITENQLGLTHWDFYTLVSKISRNSPNALDTFLEIYEDSDEADFVYVKTYPLRITKEGPIPAESKVLAEFRVDPEVRDQREH